MDCLPVFESKVSLTLGNRYFYGYILKLVESDFLGPQDATRLVLAVKKYPVISDLRERISRRDKIFSDAAACSFLPSQIELQEFVCNVSIASVRCLLSCPSTGDSKRLNQQDRFTVSMAGSGPSDFFFDSRCAV